MTLSMKVEDYGRFKTDPKTGLLRTGGEDKLVVRDDENLITTFSLDDKELADAFMVFLQSLNDEQLAVMKSKFGHKSLVVKGGLHRRQPRYGFRD